jgi:putative nucleotidyltransferase with HDIG domain
MVEPNQQYSPSSQSAVDQLPGGSQSTSATSGDMDRRSLLPINIHTLCASTLLEFDLYYQKDKKSHLTLYRDRNYPLTQTDLDQLIERGVETLFIRSEEAGDYRTYHEKNVLANNGVALQQRYQVLKEAARGVFLEAIRGNDLNRSLQITETLGTQLVDTVCHSQMTLDDILEVMAHDYGTFTHALNVATFALLLTQSLGIRDEGELVRIGQGALLHDIGKRHVPRAILEKNGPLNDLERQILMKHPGDGFRDLSKHDELDWGQLMMIYQHHERCDCRGYPSSLHGREIHDHARICAIADVTDALMRDRPYRKAAVRGEVIDYFDRQAGRGLDEEMTRCWMAQLSKPS